MFTFITKLTGNSIILNSALSLLVVLFLAFLIQQINNRYSFIRIRTVLPASLFVIIIGGFTSLHVLHPIYFATIFLLLAIYRSFNAFDNPKPYSAAFDTGLLIGIGSIFYFNFIIIFPAFFFGISILSRNNGWRQFVLLIMGFVLPYIFAIGYSVFTNQFTEFFRDLTHSIVFYNGSRINVTIPQLLLLSYLMVLTAFGSIKIIQQFDTKKVSTRKYFMVFFLIFILSLAGFFITPSSSHEMLVLIAVPLTFLISNYFVFFRSRLWGEIMFSILLIIVITIQFLG